MFSIIHQSKIHSIPDKEKDKEKDVKTYDIFGLMFYILLRKGYYDGAKQLIETGCVST
jgi:hypothetical protein